MQIRAFTNKYNLKNSTRVEDLLNLVKSNFGVLYVFAYHELALSRFETSHERIKIRSRLIGI